MIQKPKDLTGEVKKFELEVLSVTQAFSTEFLKGGEYLEPIHHKLMQLNDIGHFYTQPFKYDLLKHFKGWDYITYAGSSTVLAQDGTNKINFTDGYVEFNSKYAIGGKTISETFIKTLSDFIDAALNSDIKLTWKTNSNPRF